MRYLITLQINKAEAALENIMELLVPLGLLIDKDYGLVCISPKRGLYVVRVEGEINHEQLLALPEVIGVHGDPKIAPIHK